MTVLTLKRSIPRHLRLDMQGIVPSRLAPASDGSRECIEIGVDERREPLADWFLVSEDGRQTLKIQGQLEGCDRIAGGMDGGVLLVVGNVGDCLAEGMRSGQVSVEGNVARFAAGGMRGGLVTISGSAGEYAAGGAPGKRLGMRGGTLVIGGDCDLWLASRMRRGTVIVFGNVAGGCASRMIAGTVVLCASTGAPLGCGMRRGTILFIGQQPAAEIPGFTSPEACELAFLSIQLDALAAHLPDRLPDYTTQMRVLRSIGDRSEDGLGELIWLPAAAKHD